jgi:hypothetical protein
MTYVLYARYEALTPELLMVQVLRGVGSSRGFEGK